jgi:hypothetical protein
MNDITQNFLNDPERDHEYFTVLPTAIQMFCNFVVTVMEIIHEAFDSQRHIRPHQIYRVAINGI